MKFRVFFIILSIFVLLPFNSSLAQSSTEDCSATVGAMQGDWRAVAAQILIEYDTAQKISVDMQRAVALQSLRRCLDQQWKMLGEKRTSADDEIYWLVQNALNLTVDSIISAQVGNADAAKSFATQASEQYASAVGLIGPVGPSPSGVAGTIDTPIEGTLTAVQTAVSGTYDAGLINPDNQLWLLVKGPDGKIYPQANNSCSTDPDVKREPIPFDLFGSNTWTMIIGLGGPANVDQQFSLLLVTADAPLSAFFNQWLDSGCKKNNFLGLTQAQIISHGKITVLQTVNVIRK